MREPRFAAWTSWLVWLLCLLVVVGCRGDGRRRGTSSAAPALSPLASRTWLESLEVRGFGASRVALPLGAKEPRPVVIALHGDADRPEWPCGSYHHAGRARAFVLCPRGVPKTADRFMLGSIEQTSKELRSALPALKARFGEHVAKGPVVLAAIGPAVGHAIAIAREEPSFFSYLVLVDGSFESFSAPTVMRFAEGGKRVLFVCTRGGCGDNVAGRVLALRSAGVDARLERVPNAMGLDGAATDTIRKSWEWLVAGDPRWR